MKPKPYLLSLFFSISFLLSVPSSSADEVGYGYTLQAVSVDPSGKSLAANLRLIRQSSTYGPDVPLLKLQASFETSERLRVKITDAEHQRWEVPPEVIDRQDAAVHQPSLPPYRRMQAGAQQPPAKDTVFTVPDSDLVLTVHATSPFGFSVSRKSNNDVLFDTRPAPGETGPGIVFKHQYLQLSSSLPADRSSVYGLGEHTKRSFQLNHDQILTMWNADIGAFNPDVNLYGSHPFYMDVRSPAGTAHGVLLLNSNGMDVEYNGALITYKVIGGVFDFYFFSGPDPSSVVQQYTELIGRPAPMPYWAFGFHQCRYGYRNVDELEEVVAGYAKAQLPLEVMWTDIDYMDQYRDFTLHPYNFPETRMKTFVDNLHRNGQRYVLILDPGISTAESYGPYLRGVQRDVFIKRDGKNYQGQVWPGSVYFPDFFNPATVSYWANEIEMFHQVVSFDGVWIDMNEASNFVTSPNLPGSSLDDPPYRINNGNGRRSINDRAIPASSVHYNNYTEYDVHNLYGFMEAKATHKALVEMTGKRPFVLSRSTFVGSGNYTAHWSGDNAASWDDLAYSIPAILNSGLLGIPMVGADICGFARSTTEELCGRWIQVGAFYPFSRDHSDKQSPRQELFLWESVTRSAKKALGLRYQLLPYFYTLMYEAHTNGIPIARPLFFSFPGDTQTYGISTQFLVGKGVLVSPVLSQGSTSVEAYFPAGIWYSLFNFSEAVIAKTGMTVNLFTPMENTNVHVKGGNILPMQEEAMTTREARKTGFQLVIALDEHGTASGEVFVDDGEQLEMGGKDGNWSSIKFCAGLENGQVKVTSEVVNGKFSVDQAWVIKKIVVLGIKANRKSKLSMEVNGVSLEASSVSTAAIGQDGKFIVAEATDLNILLGENFELKLQLLG